MTYRKHIKTSLFCATVALLGTAATGCSTDLGDGDYQVFRVAFESEQADASCYVDGEIPENIREDSTNLKSGGTFIMYQTEQDEIFLDTGSMVIAGELEGSTYEFDGEAVDVDVPPGRTILDADHDGIEDSEDSVIDSDRDGLDDNAIDEFTGLRVDEMVDIDYDGLDDRTEDDMVDANMDGEDDRYVELPAGYKLRTTRTYKIEITMAGDVVNGESRTTVNTNCEGTECPMSFEATTCTLRNDFQGVLIEDAQVDVALGAPTSEPDQSSN